MSSKEIIIADVPGAEITRDLQEVFDAKICVLTTAAPCGPTVVVVEVRGFTATVPSPRASVGRSIVMKSAKSAITSIASIVPINVFEDVIMIFKLSNWLTQP
jgi:hypothetical protein